MFVVEVKVKCCPTAFVQFLFSIQVQIEMFGMLENLEYLLSQGDYVYLFSSGLPWNPRRLKIMQEFLAQGIAFVTV